MAGDPTSEGKNHLIAERQNFGDAESQLIDLPQPARQPVPTRAVLVQASSPQSIHVARP
jgi:hypothetical protein